jgi:DNA-binding beta-propeller fold protein YncE
MSNPYDVAVNSNTNVVYVTDNITDKVFVIKGSEIESSSLPMALIAVIGAAAAVVILLMLKRMRKK